jgi:asparagine N-glycosylation enzyme membrane subunit Stt3
MMNPFNFLALLIFASACIGSLFYLLRRLKKDRQLISLVGLFCMAMGVFLLVLDLVLITFTHGPQTIPDYLLFNRLVSDTGFAGRWVLTVYVFISAGLLISIYLLARNLITKFNNKRGKGKLNCRKSHQNEHLTIH